MKTLSRLTPHALGLTVVCLILLVGVRDARSQTVITAGVGVSASSTTIFTNKTLDCEATGNVCTIPFKLYLPTAGGTAAAPSSIWNLPASNPAVAVVTAGTNTIQGTLDFADGANAISAQIDFWLPSDWSGNIDARFLWFSSTTSGNVVWQIATSCVADGETNDPAFNTASTVTNATKGTANQLNTASITSITTTGCAAGELMHIKVTRDPAHASDTMAGTARLVGVELTYRRAI